MTVGKWHNSLFLLNKGIMALLFGKGLGWTAPMALISNCMARTRFCTDQLHRRAEVVKMLWRLFRSPVHAPHLSGQPSILLPLRNVCILCTVHLSRNTTQLRKPRVSLAPVVGNQCLGASLRWGTQIVISKWLQRSKTQPSTTMFTSKGDLVATKRLLALSKTHRSLPNEGQQQEEHWDNRQHVYKRIKRCIRFR